MSWLIFFRTGPRSGHVIEMVSRGARRLCVVAGLFCGCATAASGGRILWEGRDEFVKVAPQGPLEGGHAAPKNDHPVRLTADRVTRALETIRFERGEGLDAVLDELAIERLAPLLAEALAEASPTEDALFAIRTRKAHWLVGGEMSSVAARVFVRDGQMNVIVGDMFRAIRSEAARASMGTETNIDRRIKPHRPGSRARVREPIRTLVTTATTTFFVTNGRERPDWLMIDLR